ncbi:MAG: restriction endonuclease subunit S [Bacteroidales bacterium]|nr:restriction endonuclease subunit S [Bacteroidales bacterium]
MEEFNKIKIQRICSHICSGGTPKSTVAAYYDGNIPWLNTKEINFNRIRTTERTITEEGLNNSSAKWIPADTVIVAMYGATAGRVAIAKKPITTNQACCNLIIDSSQADYRFVYYALCNDFNIIASMANGGAQQNLNAQQIKEYQIPFPNLYEQCRIADILSALDDKIELNRRINDNLEEQAQALFRSWFVDFEPWGGVMPEDWEMCSMGELTEQCTQKVGSRTDVRVLSPVSSGELVLSDEFFTKQVYSKELSKYIVVEPDTFAYNPARINIGSIGINAFSLNGCVSPVYVVFKVQTNYEQYINSFIKTKLFKEEVALRAIGGVRQTLSYNDFSMIEVVKPSVQIVEQFAAHIGKLHAVMLKNDKQSERLASLRDTLLPKLMSGELKINQTNS